MYLLHLHGFRFHNFTVNPETFWHCVTSARLAWCPSHRTRTCIALYTVKSSTSFRAWQCSESLWSFNLRYLSRQHTSINCRSLLGYLESYRLLLAVIFPQLESKRHFLALLCSAAASFCTSVPALISHRWLSSPFFEAWLCRHPAISHGTLVSKRSVKAKNCSSVHIYEGKSAQMQKLVLWF